jgi:hypothetical protein
MALRLGCDVTLPLQVSQSELLNWMCKYYKGLTASAATLTRAACILFLKQPSQTSPGRTQLNTL